MPQGDKQGNILEETGVEKKRHLFVECWHGVLPYPCRFQGKKMEMSKT